MNNEIKSVKRAQAATGNSGISKPARGRYCKIPACAGMNRTGVIAASVPGSRNIGSLQYPDASERRWPGDDGPVVKLGGRR